MVPPKPKRAPRQAHPEPEPCPFCGTRGLIAATTWPVRKWYVDCVFWTCRARGPERSTLRSAVVAWNQRFSAKKKKG